MTGVSDVLSDHLASVRRRIQQVCERSRRDPSSVTLICVTKGVSSEWIERVLSLGVIDIGENRVQEARAKQLALGSGLKAGGDHLEPRALSLEPIRWHLIGHLQRNKARDAVRWFDVIHSVDSLQLIQELERRAEQTAQGAGGDAQWSQPRGGGASWRRPELLIQVNVSGEASKFGCKPQQLGELAQEILRSAHLRLAGLMTITPFTRDSEASRPHFRRMRQLREDLAAASSLEPRSLSLSMGMSQDFEVAIEEGANFVRLGTAIFGPRG